VIVIISRIVVSVEVPDGYHGVIRIIEDPKSGALSYFFPKIDVPENGFVTVTSINPLLGYSRTRAYTRSGRGLPNHFDYKNERSAEVFFWHLPTSPKREVYFFVGSAIEYRTAIENPNFLRDLAKQQ
jgi:hypothetical protein